MELDQKHITTIRMHDGKGNDIQLAKDGADYQLRLSSGCDVVTITLGQADVRKLCHQIIQLDLDESWKAHSLTPPELRSLFLHTAGRSIHDSMAAWLARMAGEMYDKPAKQTVN